jgi:hypothetical protein
VAPPPAPAPESLRTLRSAVVAGKLAGTADLCDRVRAQYERNRDAEHAKNDNQWFVDSFMACYCLYAKTQVLTLAHDFPAAELALAAARGYRTTHPETTMSHALPLFQELDAISAGLLLEKQGKLDAAVQAYLPANSSAKATSRLAVISQTRGQTDQARTWAFINADDPTSQWVLAEVALKSNNNVVAQRHAAIAANLIQKSAAGTKEFMPVYYCEAPAIFALRRNLQKFAPKPPAPAVTTPPPAPPPPPAAPPLATGPGIP